MTSKEALESIIADYHNSVIERYYKSDMPKFRRDELYEIYDNRFEVVKQDLERLEKLEKENESLKLTIKCQNASEEQIKSYALGLEQENKKLKKAIEIMTLKAITPYIFVKKIKRNVIDLKFEEKICFDFGINKKEFELLKEVLCDGKMD